MFLKYNIMIMNKFYFILFYKLNIYRIFNKNYLVFVKLKK